MTVKERTDATKNKIRIFKESLQKCYTVYEQKDLARMMSIVY